MGTARPEAKPNGRCIATPCRQRRGPAWSGQLDAVVPSVGVTSVPSQSCPTPAHRKLPRPTFRKGEAGAWGWKRGAHRLRPGSQVDRRRGGGKEQDSGVALAGPNDWARWRQPLGTLSAGLRNAVSSLCQSKPRRRLGRRTHDKINGVGRRLWQPHVQQTATCFERTVLKQGKVSYSAGVR